MKSCARKWTASAATGGEVVNQARLEASDTLEKTAGLKNRLGDMQNSEEPDGNGETDETSSSQSRKHYDSLQKSLRDGNGEPAPNRELR